MKTIELKSSREILKMNRMKLIDYCEELVSHIKDNRRDRRDGVNLIQPGIETIFNRRS